MLRGGDALWFVCCSVVLVCFVRGFEGGRDYLIFGAPSERQLVIMVHKYAAIEHPHLNYSMVNVACGFLEKTVTVSRLCGVSRITVDRYPIRREVTAQIYLVGIHSIF